jgi:hypothetical protein
LTSASAATGWRPSDLVLAGVALLAAGTFLVGRY